jgi:selenocysteine lyase/cysteine desulfurase
MTPMPPPLPCLKHLFSLPADRHYINCARMAPLSKKVEKAGVTGIERKVSPDAIDTELFFTESDRIRNLFAQLIGTHHWQRVALQPSASYGMATVARNLHPSAEHNIVLLHEQFPSNVYSWRRLAAETGCQIRTVEAPSDRGAQDQGQSRGAAWNQRLLEAIDSNTAALAVPLFHWADGTRFDLPAVSRRAREVGAAVIIDGTQSIGAVPFDFDAIEPDALVCAGYKTLHGPYSSGATYFGERFLEGVPLEENWITRAGSEDFAGLVDYSDSYQPGAVRFDSGERSNFILNPMFEAALEQLLEWQPARIENYCRELTAELFDQVRALGYSVEDEKWRGHHLFGIRPPAGTNAATIQAALAERNVSVSVRGTAVRVSPNVYNDADDIAALLEALESALQPRR